MVDMFGDTDGYCFDLSPAELEAFPPAFSQTYEKMISEIDLKMTRLITQIKTVPPEKLRIFEMVTSKHMFEVLMSVPFPTEGSTVRLEDTALDDFIAFLEIQIDLYGVLKANNTGIIDGKLPLTFQQTYNEMMSVLCNQTCHLIAQMKAAPEQFGVLTLVSPDMLSLALMNYQDSEGMIKFLELVYDYPAPFSNDEYLN
jgi:hypothetical protein